MKEFINTLSLENYTISAVIVGLLLCQDLDYDQQDLLGGWLMLVGQLIETNSGFASWQMQKQQEQKEKTDAFKRRQN